MVSRESSRSENRSIIDLVVNVSRFQCRKSFEFMLIQLPLSLFISLTLIDPILSFQLYLYTFQHFLLAIFFGVFHQGGLIMSLLTMRESLLWVQTCSRGGPEEYINSKDCSSSKAKWFEQSLANVEPPFASQVNLVFWHTFMPPRHLLLPPREYFAFEFNESLYRSLRRFTFDHLLLLTSQQNRT